MAGRHNYRVRVFTADGKFLEKWTNLGSPWGLAYVEKEKAIYMCDGVNNRVVKVDLKGKVLMPAFGSSSTMSQAQIADVEAYILRLNGVDRARLVSPGMDPKLFFFVALAAFAMVDVAGLIASARLARG